MPCPVWPHRCVRAVVLGRVPSFAYPRPDHRNHPALRLSSYECRHSVIWVLTTKRF